MFEPTARLRRAREAAFEQKPIDWAIIRVGANDAGQLLHRSFLTDTRAVVDRLKRTRVIPADQQHFPRRAVEEFRITDIRLQSLSHAAGDREFELTDPGGNVKGVD